MFTVNDGYGGPDFKQVEIDLKTGRPIEPPRARMRSSMSPRTAPFEGTPTINIHNTRNPPWLNS